MKLNTVKRLILIAFILSLPILSFQNCAKHDFASVPPPTEPPTCLTGFIYFNGQCIANKDIAPVIEFSKYSDFHQLTNNFSFANDFIYIRVKNAKYQVLGCVEADLPPSYTVNNHCATVGPNWDAVESISQINTNLDWMWMGTGSYTYTYVGQALGVGGVPAGNRINKSGYLQVGIFRWYFKNDVNGLIGSGQITIGP